MFAISIREIQTYKVHFNHAYCDAGDLFIAHILAKGSGNKCFHTDNVLYYLGRCHENKPLTLAMNFLLYLSVISRGVKFYVGGIVVAQLLGAALYCTINYLPKLW